MDATPTIATALLQAGLLMGVALLGHLVAVRHLPVENIPGVLRSRVELSSRLRPWLIGAALAMSVAGLVLQLR